MSASAYVAGLALLCGQSQQGILVPGGKKASVPVASTPADRDADLLLVDVIYGSLRLTQALSALQDDKGRRYLPLRELSRALDFRLHVDPRMRSARGFLTSPTDRLDMDGRVGTYKRTGATCNFDPSLCFEKDGELYVEAELLGDIAGLRFLWRMARLELEVQSEMPLTVKRHLAADPNAAAKAPKLAMDVIATPYRWWTLPSFDVQMYTAADTTGDQTQRTSSLAFDGVGDLAFMSARYRLTTGTDGRPIARMTLGREDADGRLLGPLRAKKIQLGDLSLPQVPLLTRGRSAVGFTISNFPLAGDDPSATEQIEGRMPPGSSVELYRDNIRLSSAVADASGRYIFQGIPLESGPNTFRIVAVTLDGELREEERTLYGDMSGPKPGQSRYRFSASQTGSSLFGSSAFSSATESRELIAEYQTGLTSGSWLSATLAEIEGSGADGHYLGLGYHSWGGGVQWHIDGMANATGGHALSAGLWRKLGGGTISLEHTRLGGDFFTTILPEIGSDATAVTKLRIDGIGGVRSHRISYGLSVDRYEGPHASTFVRARLSGGSRDIFFSNSLAARLGDGPFEAAGLLQLRKRYGPSSLRFDLGYGLGAASGIRTGRLTFDRRISADYRMQYGLEYDALRAGALAAIGTLYRMVGPLAVGLSFAVDEQGALKASLLLTAGVSAGSSIDTLAFSRPGGGEMGSISLRVFLDRNVSGKFDEGDVLLPGIGLKVGGRHVAAKTGPGGVCHLERLLPYQDVAVGLNEDTFEDPCWMAAKPGIVAVLRPGTAVKADLAVIETAEIEGRVIGAPSGGLIAELITRTGGVMHTSFVDNDGVYVFSRVRPGEYTLRLTDMSGQKVAERAIKATPAAIVKGFDVKATKS